MQPPGDSDERALAVEDERRAAVRHVADRYKRAVDLDEAGRRPVELSLEELV